MQVFFLPNSAYCENICEIKQNDNEKKNLKQTYIFCTKLAISPTDIVPTGIFSTDTSLNFFADRYTDRFFASRTSIPQAVVGLYLKYIYLIRVYIKCERIQVLLQKKECLSFFRGGRISNCYHTRKYIVICGGGEGG